MKPAAAPTDLPVTYDAAWIDRMAALGGAADQRVSAGNSLVDNILSFKKGVYEDEKFPDEEPRREVFVVPLLIRESRTYWVKAAAKGEKPRPPDCKSVNGLEPVPADPSATPLDDVLQPQAVKCSDCPWNKFGTADNGGGGKKCKTGGNLFGIEVKPDGTPIGSILVRYSASNSNVNRAIDLADRKGAPLPRCLNVWKLQSGRGKAGDSIFEFMEPVVHGPANKALYPAIEKAIAGLTERGAVDAFLGGITKSAD